MHRISTNLTLFLKIFIPTFWIVFFGAVTLAVFLTDYQYVGNIPRGTFQLIVLLFYLSGLAMFYFTLLDLKRVEMDNSFVYVTNYFKTYRYPYHNVERIEVSKFLFFSTANLYLIEPGNFGRRILFVPSLFRLRDFLDSHPGVRESMKVNGL